ncbi:MAG TPA: gluconokinase [Blastocatellia bacterium]|nr:gluconokinase [Blastocatellia bacterium]
MSAISLAESQPPFIVAVDLGTSSARAYVYDSRARHVEGLASQIAYRMTVKQDGGVEIDPDLLVQIAIQALDQLHVSAESLLRGNEIAAVALTTFWHAMMGVDSRGCAATPLYSWNDTRPRTAARNLRAKLNERTIHQRTGCMIHSSYWPAKLSWLQTYRSPLADNVARWISIGDYLFFKLFGSTSCSTSMASATGLFDQKHCDWDDEMLSAVSISRGNLPELRDLDAPFTKLEGSYIQRWPLFSDAKWFPAVGDGACSNIGAGCFTRDSAAINIGTSGALRVLWEPDGEVTAPRRGAWCYRADRRRVLIGGALSNGGDLIAWMRETLRVEPIDQVEALVAGMEPDSHGLTVLPFLSGERSTGWNDSARFLLSGATLDTTSAEIVRAGIESVAYRFAAIYDVISKSLEPREVIASGAAAAAFPTWIQIIADVLGRPVTLSSEREATSRGAAIMALEAMSFIPVIEMPAAMGSERGQVFQPDEKRHARYREARERQEQLYQAVFGSPSINDWTE